MKKKLLVALAVGALTAATAVPALALENEFHGAFTAFYDLSNYSGSGAITEDSQSENYFVQRFRLNYNAKASEQVKLVSRFEFDFNFWGNSAYGFNQNGTPAGRGGGGAIGADTVNMETKNIYLELNYPIVNAKIGMMAHNDAFKGLLFDGDMAGVLLAHNYENAGVSAGFFRFNDSNDAGSAIGKNSNDMFMLEGKYGVAKDVKVGAGYYFIQDDSNANDAEVHSLGLNAEGKIGPVAINGLVLGQFGDLNATTDAEGVAVNVGVRVPVAGGTLRSEFLYVTGGDKPFFIAQGIGGTEGGQFYDAEMTMLGRNKFATTIDNAIIYDVNNNGEGVIMGTVGYDYSFSDKLSASANVGFAAIQEDAAGAAAARGITRGDSDYLGTEINAETYYNLTSNVTLGARAGYVFLGDYFANDPDNIYDVKLVARYNRKYLRGEILCTS